MEEGEEQAGPRRLVLTDNIAGMTRWGTVEEELARRVSEEALGAEGRGRKRRKEGRGDGDGGGDDDDDRAKGDEEKEARAREAERSAEECYNSLQIEEADVQSLT